MYIDLIILVVLMVFVIIYSKRFQTYFFGVGVIDILFRILNIIKGYIPNKKIIDLINTYIPSSVYDVICKYTNGIFETVLVFIYVVIMAIFLYYIIRIFIKRKKF